MSSPWNLPQQLETAPDWEVVRVLVSYDGEAEIALAKADGLTHLAVAAADLDGAARWIAAPISSTETKALLASACDIRSVLLKPSGMVLDMADGRPVRAWRYNLAELADDFLPLPSTTLEGLISDVPDAAATSELLLDGEAVHDHQIPIRVLAALFDAKQRLWNALAQLIFGAETTQRGLVGSELRRLATIDLQASPSPGSLILQIASADDEAFNKIAQRFGTLVRASGSIQTLNAELGPLGPRTRSAYSYYLEQVEKYGVEVFTRWPRGGAFLTPFAAASYRRSLQAVESVESETLTVAGALSLYNSKTGNFEFKASEDDVTYSGYVSSQVQEEHPALLVGQADVYTVEIEVQRISVVAAAAIQNCILRKIVGMPTSQPSHRDEEGQQRYSRQ